MQNKVPKDWLDGGEPVAEVIRSEDFPKFLTSKEVAEVLRVTPSAARSLMTLRAIRSVKIGKKRLTTAVWLADYINQAIRKNA